MSAPRRGGSLRLRLLLATLAAIAVALVLAGAGLQRLFRDHAMRQYEASLAVQLDQLTARLEFDAGGEPRIAAPGLSDPRWERPLSGLYWQVDALGAVPRAGVLRSRSLWDEVLRLGDDEPAAGTVHVHALPGPGGAALVAVERGVSAPDDPASRWRLVVAGDAGPTEAAIGRFSGMLAASLATLGLMLAAAAVAQVAIGLAPLRAMRRSLLAVRDGRAARMDGGFPAEVQPLVDAFDEVLEHNARLVERARTHAGNLAHAVRTPLSVLRQAAAAARAGEEDATGLARIVDEQVDAARRHVDRHLARARAAAASRRPGASAPVAPTLAALGRVLRRVHADRQVELEVAEAPGSAGAAFAGEEQDLQELLGNLLDNAFKWARSRVRVTVERDGERLRIVVDDDGPGIPPAERTAVLGRGVRADESVAGSGLGLAIVQDLALLHDGDVDLGASPLGGLRVVLRLPAVRPADAG